MIIYRLLSENSNIKLLTVFHLLQPLGCLWWHESSPARWREWMIEVFICSTDGHRCSPQQQKWLVGTELRRGAKQSLAGAGSPDLGQDGEQRWQAQPPAQGLSLGICKRFEIIMLWYMVVWWWYWLGWNWLVQQYIQYVELCFLFTQGFCSKQVYWGMKWRK